MSFKPSPKHALLLWRMIAARRVEEREPKLSAARPSLQPAERRELLDAGFLALEKRGRATHLLVADKAWAWAESESNVALLKSRSATGADALQDLLHRLVPFLQERGLPLASLFSDVQSSSSEASPNGSATIDPPLSTQIEQACLSLTAGARQTRVKLSELRKLLASVKRSTLDRELLKLQDEQKLVLYREDNSAALTEEDRQAALMVGDAPRHVLLLEA